MNKEINQLRFIEFLLCPEFLINTLTVLSHLTLKIFSDIGIFYHLHFTNEEAEVHRCQEPSFEN